MGEGRSTCAVSVPGLSIATLASFPGSPKASAEEKKRPGISRVRMHTFYPDFG